MDGEELYTLFDDNDYGDRILYVPKGCVNVYKLTFGWSQFKEIHEMEDAGMEETTADDEWVIKSIGNRTISIDSPSSGVLSIYDLRGRLLLTRDIHAGNNLIHGLPGGAVVIKGKKILVN